jgi:threonylcarbamoyladenosine tRNA methylthiotransferase MtaB
MSLDILTFGCRLNAYESEVMRGHAAGLAATGAADLIIVNTCAVTGEAERQARQAIRRAHRDRPDAAIVVTGCAAQIDPAAWRALPGVTRVLGNLDKLRPESWAAGAAGSVSDIAAGGVSDGIAGGVSDGIAGGVSAGIAGGVSAGIAGGVSDGRPGGVAAYPVAGFPGRARGFVQVQQGCDHRCTFCVIPLGRGPSRSVPLGGIVAQVRALLAAGHREVVLTGVDLTSYGADLPGRPGLGQAARRLLALVPELDRLRLSSLDPQEIDEDLWRLIAAEPRLMPHLHLSLQSGSDLILKRMKRRHSRAGALAVIARARRLRPGIAIGADLIAGFPTETEALFAETLAFLEEADIPLLHVFPYSARPATPAARMPAVPMAERRARAGALRAAGDAAAARFAAAQLGRRVAVLVERDGRGHTEHFLPATLGAAGPAGGAAAGAAPDRAVAPPGTLVAARVTGTAGATLLAEAL